ncbi:hypothetical protein TgHK011_000073 [Trichoderma gracile]|nr:hypothetical protein TgHK011_000073 [Trichoderma gracile]
MELHPVKTEPLTGKKLLLQQGWTCWHNGSTSNNSSSTSFCGILRIIAARTPNPATPIPIRALDSNCTIAKQLQLTNPSLHSTSFDLLQLFSPQLLLLPRRQLDHHITPTTKMTGTIHHIESVDQLDALLSSTTYVAVDFYADWCPPCKAIAPIYQTLADKHSVDKHLAFAKVNVDHVQDVAARYGITAMPTFLFFKEGQQVAVNGKPMIQGADPRSLGAAVEKLSGLAQKRVEEANAASA